MRAATESMLFITADGERYPLQGNRVKLVDEDGTGIPEIEFITQTGPFQHGATMLDYFLKPRVIQLAIVRKCRCRDDYWRERQRLINIIRPNRGEGTLRKVMRDGTTRDIKVYIMQGPTFPTRGGWDEYTLYESLRFIANDPVWFDPTQESEAYSPLIAPAATFPMTFPVYFPAYSLINTINYEGNWITYPTITVEGPISFFTIENTTTNEKLTLNYGISAGETVTFNLAYGIKTVQNNSGDNLIPYITEDSDLATFHLEPGNNVITLSGSGITMAMQITVSWYNRYIALAGVA